MSEADSAGTGGKLIAGVVPALMSPAARQIVSTLTGVLVQAAHPKRIILFGSQTLRFSGQGLCCSARRFRYGDFDIMVVEEKPVDRFAEMVSVNRLIRSTMSVDLLVVSDEKFQYWRSSSG